MPRTKKMPTITFKEAIKAFKEDEETMKMAQKYQKACSKDYQTALSVLNETAKQAAYATKEWRALINLAGMVSDLANKTREEYMHEYYTIEGDWDFIETNSALREPLEGYVKQLIGIKENVHQKIEKMVDEQKKKLYNELVSSVETDLDIASRLARKAEKKCEASYKAVLAHPDAIVDESEIGDIANILNTIRPTLAYEPWGMAELNEDSVIINGFLAGGLLVDEYYIEVDNEEGELEDALDYDEVIKDEIVDPIEDQLRTLLPRCKCTVGFEFDYAYIPEEAKPTKGKVNARLGLTIHINIASAAKKGE